MEYLNYLGSMVTNYARCTREIKQGLPLQSSIQQEESFHQELGLTFKEETSHVLHVEHGFVWCWNLDNSESISEIPVKF